MINSININFEKRHQLLIIIIIAILCLPVLAAFLLKKQIIIIAYLGGLFFITSVQFPRFCFYSFLTSTAIFYPTLIGRFAIHPFDLFFLLFFLSILFEVLLRGKSKFDLTKLDLPFILLICSSAISAILAYNPSYSIVPTIRIITIYLAFRAFYNMIPRIGFRKVLNYYIYMVFILSLINVFLLIKSGGSTRIFGPAWLTFETFSMTAIPMTMGYIIWSEDKKEKIKFIAIGLVIFIALLGTQSRAPLLAVVIASGILFFTSLSKSTGTSKIRMKSNMLKLLFLLGSLFVIAFLFKDSIFQGAFQRVEMLFTSLTGAKGTVYLRLVLWKAALQVFWDNPLFGVGIGNYKLVGQMIPELRFSPVWYYIKGFSAHNVILQYLAETGLAGTSALIAILYLTFKSAVTSFKKNGDILFNQINTANFIAIMVVIITMFYMRAWVWGQDGYLMAFLFAFNLSWFKANQSEKTETEPKDN